MDNGQETIGSTTESTPRKPSLKASTGNVYCCSIGESRTRQNDALKHSTPGAESTRLLSEEEAEWNYFKSAQWAPDGTSILTSSADNTVRTFIIPPDLLDDTLPKTITPYTTQLHPTSINCLAPYPHFNLSDPNTTLYLSTPNSLPTRLLNALSPASTPAATYPLISPTTEAYYTPASILWSAPSSFLAGTDCLIALFDVSRNGQGPVTRLPTIPSKRHKMKGGGVGMRGIVSALSMQPTPGEEDSGTGMLAAGTWTRWVGLYDANGMGGTVAQWSVAEAADEHVGVGGGGVTQTLWSACGRYLCVVERKSGGVLVYDVRVTGKVVAWLEGREAWTNQRLGVDVFEAEGGMEVWAGGVDGVVRVWAGVGRTEGAVGRAWEWKAHDDPVTSTIVHRSGTVVATCSGQRSTPDFDDSESSSDESDSEDDSDESSDEDSEQSSSDDDSANSSADSSVSSRQSVKLNSRTPDNSIKIWSL